MKGTSIRVKSMCEETVDFSVKLGVHQGLGVIFNFPWQWMK